MGARIVPITRYGLHHSSADVTAGYIQFDAEDLREPMQFLEDLFLSAPA
jgi:hypothetical protein